MNEWTQFEEDDEWVAEGNMEPAVSYPKSDAPDQGSVRAVRTAE